VDRLDEMMKKYLRLSSQTDLSDDVDIAALKAAEWRIIDLAIAVESDFGVEMSADKALSLKTVGDWRNLVRSHQEL